MQRKEAVSPTRAAPSTEPISRRIPLVQIIPELELLPEVGFLLNGCPELAGYPERLAAELEAAEQAVRACLEVLEVEGVVLA
jgi:hypothetical protein